MKVYFMATPRGKDKFGKKYLTIYKIIESLGYEHTTDFVLKVDVDKFYLSDIRPFYKETTKNLRKADICVFETSIHSLAIGHLIQKSIDQGKPVIALYTGNQVPFFLSGSQEEDVQILQYNLQNVSEVIEHALENAGKKTDTRFNFFISQRLITYLDWIAKYRRIPRAVYLRQLINKEMLKHRTFLEGS